MNHKKICHVLSVLIVVVVFYVAVNDEHGHIVGRLPSALLPQLVRQMTSPYRNRSGDPCTFGLLRLAYKERGYFPGGGRWLNANGTDHYEPEACRLRYARMPAGLLSRCLASANLSYIVTMGDSTGGRYNLALLRNSAIKCRPVRSERLTEGGFLPDKEYFTARMPPTVGKFVRSRFRFCAGCASHRDRCTYTHENKSYAVTFEHIAQTMILDNSLEIVFPSYQVAKATALEEVWALTTQELIARYYLQRWPPDVLIVFLPFAHAKVNIPLSRLPMEIRYFKALLDEYLPQTTKIIFMTFYSEFEAARKEGLWKNRRFEGMMATDKIDKMNHVLYQVLQDDLLEEGGRYFGFFDLVRASADRGSWSIDGVHMTPVWYESVVAMFWQTFCNSVLLDQF